MPLICETDAGGRNVTLKSLIQFFRPFVYLSKKLNLRNLKVFLHAFFGRKLKFGADDVIKMAVQRHRALF